MLYVNVNHKVIQDHTKYHLKIKIKFGEVHRNKFKNHPETVHKDLLMAIKDHGN
jgi:hypothetical protein